MLRQYTIRYVPSARNDLIKMKKYILINFKYLEYGENFDKKIEEASKIIKNSPLSFEATEFTYRDSLIYMRCINAYQFFYIVDNTKISVLRVLKNGQDWQRIISLWLKKNNY